jgi:transposase
MRGVSLIVASAPVAEVGDFRRFDNPRQLMAYLGLVPSEHSSGAKRRGGAITEAGSPLARRMLVEGAWTYRLPARVSAQMRPRLAGLPREVRDMASRAQVRLCARYRCQVAEHCWDPVGLAIVAYAHCFERLGRARVGRR